MSRTEPTRHERARSLISRTGHSLEKGAALRDDMAEDKRMISSAIRQHEAHDHGAEPRTKLHFKSGGAVDGEAAKSHLAKRARGGATKGKSTHVNVIVAPQAGMHPPGQGMMPPGQPMMPPHPPMAAPPPGGAQPMMPPRPPMAAAPGAGMPPPGMKPPGMMKRGGGVKTSEEGVPSESLLQAKKGGKIERAKGGHVPHMTAGALGAEGRIQKMHEYGEGGFKPKEHPGEFVGKKHK